MDWEPSGLQESSSRSKALFRMWLRPRRVYGSVILTSSERENSTTVSTSECTDDSEDLDLVLETGPTRDTHPSPTPAPEHPRPEVVLEVTAPTPPAPTARYPAHIRQPPDYFGH